MHTGTLHHLLVCLLPPFVADLPFVLGPRQSCGGRVLPAGDLPAGGDGVRVEGVFEGEEEGGGDDTLGDLRSDACLCKSWSYIHSTCFRTSIQASVPLLADDSAERGQHVLAWPVPAGNVHPRLDGDVWVCDARREQLAERAHVEGILGRDPPLLLHHLLELLEDGVLQDWVDHQHQRRHDAREKARWALVADEGEERAEGRGRLRGCRAG